MNQADHFLDAVVREAAMVTVGINLCLVIQGSQVPFPASP